MHAPLRQPVSPALASSPRRVVLLDRDGTINRDRPGSVLRQEDFELIPGAIAAIAALSRAGYAVALITNQACIGRGEVSAATVAAIHAGLAAEIAAAGGRLDGIYVAAATDPADPDRKPNPGLVLRAQADLGFVPAETWLVGDDSRDIEAARRAGVRPALVLTGKGVAAHVAYPDVPAFADLAAFAQALLAGSPLLQAPS
jgi:D-glycero-D-manno-heptose 1,7-bisphosphate phosphatase